MAFYKHTHIAARSDFHVHTIAGGPKDQHSTPAQTAREERGDTPHQNLMPVHMGVMCERCQKIHFIAKSSGIQISRSGGAGGGMYRLNCPPPCAEMKEFRKEGMRPYRVADEVFRSLGKQFRG